MGEWATLTVGHGERRADGGTDITLCREIRFPHSLGMLYSTFTAYLGFAVNEDEYKVMGLAAYGRPTMIEQVRQVIRRTPDGAFALVPEYFEYQTTAGAIVLVAVRRPVRAAACALRADRPRDRRRAGASPIAPPACSACSKTRSWTWRARCITRPACRICASAAASRSTAWPTRGSSPSPGFERVFVPPAPGDAGCALGAALYADRIYFGNPDRDVPDHPFWGPAVDAGQLARAAREDGQAVDELDDAALIERIADELAAGRIVGWMDGACEFGPRALGHRSMLAAPHSREMRDRLNRDIKYREEFRPFAPVVPDRGGRSLLRAAARRRAAGALHVGRVSGAAGVAIAGSRPSRTSTARRACRCSSATWRRGCTRCSRRTGAAAAIPVLLNTSFNVAGEPIVNARARRLLDVPALRHRRARRRPRPS